ncbi:Uncharacterised protein [Psychrobacter phenylpyruvicus]|uniref:Uncharacterized protein n=1 Tax=Psychrobacter phenylpyruvicus TaxID=29432 RepID=A0A379LIM0_9GAMM|nr:Uncharacterised protein [Psychrobacter phenylpyruvicus]
MVTLMKIPDNHNDYRVSLQIASVIMLFLSAFNKCFFILAYWRAQKFNRVFTTALCPLQLMTFYA